MALSSKVLALLLVAVCAIYYANSAVLLQPEEEFYPWAGSRLNLILGSIGAGDVMLYRTVAVRNATAGVIQTQDVLYRGFGVNITYIAAVESGFTQNATATLISGGLRQANATIRLRSTVSRGYNYTISIYGK